MHNGWRCQSYFRTLAFFPPTRTMKEIPTRKLDTGIECCAPLNQPSKEASSDGPPRVGREEKGRLFLARKTVKFELRITRETLLSNEKSIMCRERTFSRVHEIFFCSSKDFHLSRYFGETWDLQVWSQEKLLFCTFLLSTCVITFVVENNASCHSHAYVGIVILSASKFEGSLSTKLTCCLLFSQKHFKTNWKCLPRIVDFDS